MSALALSGHLGLALHMSALGPKADLYAVLFGRLLLGC